MLYQFELLLDTKNIKFALTDRNGENIEYSLSDEGTLTKITAQISMPNKIWLDIVRTDPFGYASLKSIKLGHIKFNNNSIDQIFVFHMGNKISRTTEWKYTGKAEFQFFDYNPIKYHLRLGSKI